MAAISDIILNDGQTTPVAHTFSPAKSNPDYSMFEDRVGGIYIGYNRLHISLTRPKGESKVANRNLKVAIVIETPVLETLGNSDSGLTPAPTVAYKGTVRCEIAIPERSTLAFRKDQRKFIANALASTAVIDAIENLAMPW